MVTPVITGTAELEMVTSEMAVLDPLLSWAVTVRLAAPAPVLAVNTTDGPDVEERFPKVLFSTQV
jgi:hypothetical protein